LTGERAMARMLSTRKNKPLVGLDVEAGSVAATEVVSNGHVAVTRFGTTPLNPGVFRDGELSDGEALSEALKELFARNKLSRSVRLGLASQRVAMRTLRLPAIDDAKELQTAVRFQAQELIPMPLDQSVLDWQVVGHASGDNGERMLDVVVVAARREPIRGLVAALRGAGLKPVGVDLSAFGMIRALAKGNNVSVGTGAYVDAPGAAAAPYEDRIAEHLGGDGSAAVVAAPDPAPARMFCNLGDVTNVAVSQGSSCLFTRVCPFGIEGIAQRLAERRQLTLDHARQWLVHVGLESPLESVDGDPDTVSAARECLGEGAIRLVDELRLTLESYATQEGGVPVDGVVACGAGTTIPGLVERLQRDLAQRFEVGRPEALAHLDDSAAARLTVSYGLGLEE
jgi:type IV pilus assembly protein PilM